MIKLVVDLLPLALAAAITPTTWTLIAQLLNRSPYPVKTGLALLAGPLLYGLLLATLTFLIAGSLNLDQKSQSYSSWSILADFVLSLVFLVMAVQAAFTKPHPNREQKLQTYLQRLAATSPFKLFLVSFLAQIPRGKTLALFLSALKVIFAAAIGPLQSILALLIYMAVAYAAYVVPFLFFFFAPQRATTTLQKMNDVLGKKWVTVLLFLFLAYLFLQSGVHDLHN